MSRSDESVRVSGASKRTMEILERRIDRTEAQLGIRRGERRLEEVGAEYAAAVGDLTPDTSGRGGVEP